MQNVVVAKRLFADRSRFAAAYTHFAAKTSLLQPQEAESILQGENQFRTNKTVPFLH